MFSLLAAGKCSDIMSERVQRPLPDVLYMFSDEITAGRSKSLMQSHQCGLSRVTSVSFLPHSLPGHRAQQQISNAAAIP